MYYIDILDSVFQSIVFIYIINYCLEIRGISTKIKTIGCIVALSINGFVVPNILGNFSICVFFTHIISMIIIFLFFKEQYIKALLSYSLVYSMVVIWIFVFGNIVYGILEKNIPIEYISMVHILLIYSSQIILFILILKKANIIKQAYRLITFEEYNKNFVFTISFIPDFLLSFYLITYNIDYPALRNAIIIALVVFIILIIISFIKIQKRAKEILKLNKDLESKNGELKKIKLQYGAQLSYIYELCFMEKFDDVGKTLKDIINNTSNLSNQLDIIQKKNNDESLLSSATKHVVSDDVNIIVEDNADLKLIAMSEIELYRIIVNIVNNAIKAMKNKGTLIVKSYEELNNIAIEIENDGEKIPDKFIDKIFEAGFTTKDNADKSHGFGLNIVKELIEYYNGKIFVQSNEERTRFTIVLPIKENENIIATL